MTAHLSVHTAVCTSYIRNCSHVALSSCAQDNHEKCMEFIKALHQANHALVDAYEKSMKQQRMEKKQMREELQTQLARVRGPEVCPCYLFHASLHTL